MVQKCATINRPWIELLIEPHLIRDHVVGQTKRCGRFLDLPLNGALSGESIAQLPGQSTVKVGAGKFGKGLAFKLSMGVSHARSICRSLLSVMRMPATPHASFALRLIAGLEA
jgi:hypothetical protein